MSKKDDTGGMIGCLALVLMVLFCMPIVGAFMAFSKDPEKRIIGIILLIVGFVFFGWVMSYQ